MFSSMSIVLLLFQHSNFPILFAYISFFSKLKSIKPVFFRRNAHNASLNGATSDPNEKREAGNATQTIPPPRPPLQRAVTDPSKQPVHIPMRPSPMQRMTSSGSYIASHGYQGCVTLFLSFLCACASHVWQTPTTQHSHMRKDWRSVMTIDERQNIRSKIRQAYACIKSYEELLDVVVTIDEEVFVVARQIRRIWCTIHAAAC